MTIAALAWEPGVSCRASFFASGVFGKPFFTGVGISIVKEGVCADVDRLGWTGVCSLS